MKICSRCGRENPLSAFYKQTGGAQGRRSHCIACYKELERESYLKDPKVHERRQQLLERDRLLVREAELTARVRELEEEVRRLRERRAEQCLGRCADGST
jgi:hypothetical protein